MKHQKLTTTPEISRRMGRVKLKRNKVETLLAKALWHQGYRYRLNDRKLPGSPDIVIPKYHIAIFVDGEFWHGKDFEEKKLKLKNNKDYWIEKIQENMNHDAEVNKLLWQQGWIVIRFWSTDVTKYLSGCIETVNDMKEYALNRNEASE